MDDEVRLLLRGVRVVLLVVAVALVILAITLGPRLRKGPPAHGDGGCFTTGTEIVCAYP
jgi:hypothetical protein